MNILMIKLLQISGYQYLIDLFSRYDMPDVLVHRCLD